LSQIIFMRKIKDKDKKIIIASSALLVFLIFTTFIHFKEASWKSLRFPFMEEVKNAPSFSDNISEEDQVAITETYHLLKSPLEKISYEEHKVNKVSFEVPLDWKKESKEDEKEDNIICSFLSEQKDYSVDVFELETGDVDLFLEKIKKSKANFLFSDLSEEDGNYFIEAEGVQENKKIISFFRLTLIENYFYGISVNIPEEDVFKKINLINHTLSSLKKTKTKE
jgi:hypothetical protein